MTRLYPGESVIVHNPVTGDDTLVDYRPIEDELHGIIDRLRNEARADLKNTQRIMDELISCRATLNKTNESQRDGGPSKCL